MSLYSQEMQSFSDAIFAHAAQYFSTFFGDSYSIWRGFYLDSLDSSSLGLFDLFLSLSFFRLALSNLIRNSER